jgi:hypothetical protein
MYSGICSQIPVFFFQIPFLISNKTAEKAGSAMRPPPIPLALIFFLRAGFGMVPL